MDKVLVERRLYATRTEAQECIDKGFVFVNGIAANKKTSLVAESDSISITAARTYVSRGGEKLEGILMDTYQSKEAIQKAVDGSAVLDVGSSTGGFTDCLIQYGAAHVDAVDVGTEQLHTSLRGDARIDLYEQTDIRTFVPTSSYDYIVGDLSFISLREVFQVLYNFGNEATKYFLLVKPQFEVGFGNTKKGIVKDLHIVHETISSLRRDAESIGFVVTDIRECKIQGGDGNQEYFFVMKKGGV